jgi:hypothetical protein
VDHEVVVESHLVATAGLERQRDSRVAPDIPELLLPVAEVRRHDLVTIDTDPDDRDLWRAVRVERNEMSEVPGRQGRSHLVVQPDHLPSLARHFAAGLTSSASGLAGAADLPVRNDASGRSGQAL